MKHFEVIISPKLIEIEEVDNPLSVTHVSAKVDGEEYVYKIKIKKGFKAKDLSKGWFGRGSNSAFYHAKNAGNIVRFNPVDNKSRKRRKEVVPVTLKIRSMF